MIRASRVLMTRNIVRGNNSVGIEVGPSSTVINNTVLDNLAGGISVGEKSLVTGNTANDNGPYGIHAVCPSTLVRNQVAGNTVDFELIGTNCFFKDNIEGDPQ